MRPTRIVLIDMSGAGNSLFPAGQLKNCVFTQATSRESEVLLHLLTHDMVIIVDSDFTQDLLALVQLIHATTPRKPIVAITSEPNSQQVVAAYRAGLSDYCFLPLEQNKLCDLLQSFCEKRRFFNKILQNISSTIASGKLLPAWIIHLSRCTIRRFRKFQRACRRVRKESLWHGVFNRIWKNRLQEQPGTPSQFKMNQKPEFTPDIVVSLSGGNGYPELNISSLGKLQVQFQNKKIDRWPSKKGRGIFAYIATSGRKIYRDVLMENFWPETAAESARNSLHVALHGLRRTFGRMDGRRDCILYRDECYYLNPDLNYFCDTHAFRQLYNEARTLENRHDIEAAIVKYRAAVELYRGDFMEEDLYEEWPTLERENLREKYFTILEVLSSQFMKTKNYSEAGRMCEQILSSDSCREDVHRKLMLCHYFSGQRDKALRQFQQCQRSMYEDLGVPPSRATVDLKEKIQAELFVI